MQYLEQNGVDTRLPLVADMYGVMANTSFRDVDLENNLVRFYAPVFEGIEYKVAAPVSDYIQTYNNLVHQYSDQRCFFSCNCILNYIYADLEGQPLQNLTGPMTFGEIAYQLLNQTLVYLRIEDI